MQQDIIIYACMYMRYTCKYGYERERERDSDRGLVLWYTCNIRSNLVVDFVITTAIIITIIMHLSRLFVCVIYVLGGYIHITMSIIILLYISAMWYILCAIVLCVYDETGNNTTAIQYIYAVLWEATSYFYRSLRDREGEDLHAVLDRYAKSVTL